MADKYQLALQACVVSFDLSALQILCFYCTIQDFQQLCLKYKAIQVSSNGVSAAKACAYSNTYICRMHYFLKVL